LVSNKPIIVKKAKEVYNNLKIFFNVFYDASGSIGRRYARQDEVGTPLCITIDFDSIKKDDVTIRERDSTKQIRVKIKDLGHRVWEYMVGAKFEKLGKTILK
jgi:glycyl-tRNA synthetase